jgi:hypothetical protein
MPEEIFNCDYCVNVSFTITAGDDNPIVIDIQTLYDELNNIYSGETDGRNLELYNSSGIWFLELEDIIFATGDTCDCPYNCIWTINPDLTEITINDLTITSCSVVTTTTFFPTPPTPVDPTNECDVLTIFPMEVNCFTTQPTFSDTYDGAVALGITGGTPPYTIIWKDGSVAPTKFNLGPGNYEAIVTDYYGDFSVSTICVLTAETTTTTTTITPTTTQKVYNDYCLQLTTFSPKQQTTSQQNISLNYNGFYNDYPSWSSNTPNVLVYWSADTTNSWIVSGLTSGTIVNSSYNDITTNDPLPLSNWQILGSTTIQNISITTGSCTTISQPNLIVNKNDPGCECDGSISIICSNGTPPYEYSIDGGLSYQNTPVFQNLCDGQYSVFIKDISGNTTSQSVTLNTPQPPVTYTLSLSYLSSTSFVVNINPQLPTGASVSFNLSHLSTFIKQPANSTETYNNVVTVLKNSVVIPPLFTPSIVSTPLTVLGHCSVAGRLKTETTTNWNITMSAGDVITGSFTNNVNTPSPLPACYTAPVTATNILLTGISSSNKCDCCLFNIVNTPIGRTTTSSSL